MDNVLFVRVKLQKYEGSDSYKLSMAWRQNDTANTWIRLNQNMNVNLTLLAYTLGKDKCNKLPFRHIVNGREGKLDQARFQARIDC